MINLDENLSTWAEKIILKKLQNKVTRNIKDDKICLGNSGQKNDKRSLKTLR